MYNEKYIDNLHDDLMKLTTENETLRNELNVSRVELSTMQANYESLKQEFDSAMSEIGKLRTRLKQVNDKRAGELGTF
jgi:uncharacterized coiled-coil DUF342 family protein